MSYLIISLRVLFSIQWKEIKFFEYVAYLALFIPNIIFHFYNVSNFDHKIDSFWVEALVYALGFSGMTMCLIVAFFNVTSVSSRSSYYIYATFAFVFGDFCSMMAYYYEFFPARFYFVERTCYVFALCVFVSYAYYDYKSFRTKNNTIKKPFQDSMFY